jgi:hypothetical protein
MRDVGAESGRGEPAGVRARRECVERRRVPAGDRLGDQRRVRALARKRCADAAGEVTVLERGGAVGPRTDDLDLQLGERPQRFHDSVEVEQACDQHAPGAGGRGDNCRSPVRRRQHEHIATEGHRLAGGVPLIESRRRDAPLLAGDDAPGSPETGGAVHAVDADDAPVPGGQRLAHRRRRSQHVNHDSDIRGVQLAAGKGDIDHATGTVLGDRGANNRKSSLSARRRPFSGRQRHIAPLHYQYGKSFIDFYTRTGLPEPTEVNERFA